MQGGCDGTAWSQGAVVNSKGGVGKTTLANNLAVYARTVDSSLPVLVLGLDDSPGPDDMFALDDCRGMALAPAPGAAAHRLNQADRRVAQPE